jgi:hypothetical protein
MPYFLSKLCFSVEFHHGISCMNILYFNQINPFYYSPLPFLFLSTSVIPLLSVHFLMPSSYTHAMYFGIIDCLLFFFLSLPLKPSHYCKLLYIMVMFLFVYRFIFWICLPHMRENVWSLSFWNWLISPDMLISSSIYLPTNNIISFFFMSE